MDLLREQERFAKYKIEQLALIKEANLLLSLSNGYVFMHDLHKYELQQTLAKSKGASTFAVTTNETEVSSAVTRLAVAVKRRLLVWTWRDGEVEAENADISLVTGIKSLTWVTATRIIAGLNASYVLVDIETSAITDIVGPGSIGGAPGQDGGRFGASGIASMGYLGMTAPTPLATKLRDDEVLLAKDINTHFINVEGNSLGRRQIPWAIAPEAVGYSYPYLLALQSTKGTLELRNPETLTLLQTIALQSASQLHIPQPNSSLARAGKGFLVLSDRCIWRMQAEDYDVQVDDLVGRGRLDEAISLLGMLKDALVKDKVGRMREIKMQKAQLLFDDRRFREAIDLFTEVNAPPERVIALYPPFIAGNVLLTHGDSADLHHVPSSSSEGQESKCHRQADSQGLSEDKTKSPKKAAKEDGGEEEASGTSQPKPRRHLGKLYIQYPILMLTLTVNQKGKTSSWPQKSYAASWFQQGPK